MKPNDKVKLRGGKREGVIKETGNDVAWVAWLDHQGKQVYISSHVKSALVLVEEGPVT